MCDKSERMSDEDYIDWTTGRLQFLKIEWGKSTTGNKKDVATGAIVSFEIEGGIVKCAQDIPELFEKEYNQITGPVNLEDTLRS